MLSQISSSENIIPAFVEIVDIAGLVKVGKFHFKMKILKSIIILGQPLIYDYLTEVENTNWNSTF